ncbi:MAG TPA: fibronectin type III domain-containing protein [Gemmatimonadales bacterium]|nr:fibronectin type III domain-containing protein [Gemmatimonadales bacterium]
MRSPDAVQLGRDLTAPIAVAAFLDTRVIAGGTYFYQVIAVYADGSTGTAAPVGVTLAAAPIAQTTLSTATPTLAPAPVTSSTSVIPVAGAAPTGVVITGTPLVAHLSWNAMANAQRYAVWRGEGTSVSVEVTPAGFTGTQFQNVVPDPRVTYRFAVTAYYPNGTSAEAPAVQFISPPMINPSGFSVRDLGQGSAAFQWQAVPGPVQYRLDGPGLPNTGVLVKSTSTTRLGIPAGPGTWKLVALYPGNYGDYQGASIASTVVRVLPPHSQPWLTKNNGPGTLSQVQTPKLPSGSLLSAYGPSDFLGQLLVYDTTGWHPGTGPGQQTGLNVWLKTPSLLWDEAGQATNEVVYGNPGDLGVGRRTWCEQGFFTLCYATAHGVPPGQPGFNDPQTITHPQPGIGADFILSMVIAKDPSGSIFLVFGKNGKYPLSPTVQLDTEGPKLVPFTCLSCHGGTYNPATERVDGAQLLPLDPGMLAFATPYDRIRQEQKIREINLIIANSDPTSAVAAYIRGLYNGAVAQYGARAQPDYVPAGWAAQAGFYRQIVRPYCATCHLAAPTQWNFASWGNFQSNAGLIRAAVCGAHTMPHSELQFKAFWTKDTGPLYLPGLLAATLGFPSCP